VGERTGIQWTESTWNPLLGCRRISPGCQNCYAETLAATRLATQAGYRDTTTNGRWNGTSVWAGEKRLMDPVRWGRGRRVFVCSMSDLFLDTHPAERIAEVFAVMAAASHHTFQVLTKRPERMRDLLADVDDGVHGDGLRGRAFEAAFRLRKSATGPQAAAFDRAISRIEFFWPLRNVWCGVTAEDQQRLDERLPFLLDVPAAVRFLSCEPILGPIVLPSEALTRGGVSWVIAGGESGGGDVRLMHPSWPRGLRDACVSAGVAFHFKQHGEWRPKLASIAGSPEPVARGSGWGTLARDGTWHPTATPWNGHQDADSPTGEVVMVRTGKHEAGRVLDGRTWDEWPAEPAADEVDTPPATMFDEVGP